MHHFGLYFVGPDVTVWDLLSIVDDEEVGGKCCNSRLLEGFEVAGFPKSFFHKILILTMHQKGVKVVFGCNVRKESERGYLNLDEAEFSVFVGRVANNGCWRSREVVVSHRVKKVL